MDIEASKILPKKAKRL